MKKLFCGVLGLLILFISVPTQAETLYFAAQAGFSSQPPSDNQDTSDSTNNFELNTQAGINAALAVGAKFGSLRGEVELSYRTNENDKYSSGGVQSGADGSLNMMTVFLNGYYEMDFFGILKPYAGLGVGYGTVALDLQQLDGTVVADDNGTVYSYQLMAGAGVSVTENLTLTAEYRYFNTITDAELTLANGINTVENSDIRSHEIRFGFRYWLF